MSIDLEIDGQLAESQRLGKLLERVAELQGDKAAMEAELKIIGGKLREAEAMAVEALAVSGLDGVRAAGKSWFTREFFSVSIPTENREAVLEAAQELCPDLVSVNTSSLKSWLMEQRGEGSGAETALADGTPFAGLVKEFREVRLSSRTVS